MARNLVLCFDGTNNQFGPNNTSIIRLIQILDRDPEKQRLYYDPGVGTLPEPYLVTRIGKRISEIFGLAFGTGLVGKVEEAYSYLMDVWEPGDQVYLFGFSRGAYTARVLAAMLHGLGLLPRRCQNLVPYVMRLFRSGRGNASPDSNYWKLCNQFRWTFARPTPDGGDSRHFHVRFMGLWDTVSSVGWVWEPATFPYTARNPSVQTIRHAMAIDERRAFFRQNLLRPLDPPNHQDLEQRWFPGVHSDVGGGYPADQGGLWRNPFGWIVDHAQQAGIILDPKRQAKVLNTPPPSATPWLDEKHESLTAAWWPAEYFPKLVWRQGHAHRRPELNRGRPRFIEPGQLIDESALRRIRETNGAYQPKNLSPRFLDAVRSLATAPGTMPYQP